MLKSSCYTTKVIDLVKEVYLLWQYLNASKASSVLIRGLQIIKQQCPRLAVAHNVTSLKQATECVSIAAFTMAWQEWKFKKIKVSK